MTEFKGPGLYADMPTADYFADPCPQPSLNQSTAKILLAKSPRHAWLQHPRLNPKWVPKEKKYREDTAIGNAAHLLIAGGRGKRLEVIQIPERIKQSNKWVVPDPAKLVDADDMTTDAAKDAFKGIVAAGGTPILHKHFDVAETIHAAAREQLALIPGCATAFREGNAEVVMIAYDEEYDIWLRSMTDWMSGLTLDWDLKTGFQSAAPHELERRMINDGWDIQAAMKERILDILDPDNQGRRSFRYVAVEDDEPYGLTVTELPESVMESGRRELHRACRLWSECLHSGKWPGYPPLINRPELPGWVERKRLDREVSEAEAGRWPMDSFAPLAVAE